MSFRIDTEEDTIAIENYLLEVKDKIYSGKVVLFPLAEYIALLLDRYEETVDYPKISGADMLRFMMEQHGHKQKHLAHLFARPTTSEVLNGRRELTIPQMRKLGKFYQMDPALFL